MCYISLINENLEELILLKIDYKEFEFKNFLKRLKEHKKLKKFQLSLSKNEKDPLILSVSSCKNLL